MSAHEAGHVLDEAQDRNADTLEHSQGLGHVGESHLLRRCHQHGARERDGLRQRQLRIRGSGRQVHDQVVEITPFHVPQELLYGAAHQRPPPHHRLALGQEELDRDHLDAVGLDRGDLPVCAGHRLTLGPDHHRNVGPGDVGVEQPDRGAGLSQSHGQVHAHRRLADPTLAGRHRDDVLHARQHLRRRRSGPSDHRAPADLDRLSPDRLQSGLHPGLDLILERACRSRQLDRERHPGSVDYQVLDHVSSDQVAPELGLLNSGQSFQDGVLGQSWHVG